MIRIPHDSNLRYLPLVYLIPAELMSRCPTLMKIPRNPYQVRFLYSKPSLSKAPLIAFSRTGDFPKY